MASLTAVVTAAAIGGCGGGGGALSSGQLKDQASRICSVSRQQTDRIATPQSPNGSGAFLRQGIAAITPELAQLRKLKPPEDAQDVYSATIAASSTKLDLLRAAERRIATGDDPSTTMKTLGQRLAPIVSQENGGWTALGIPACVSR